MALRDPHQVPVDVQALDEDRVVTTSHEEGELARVAADVQQSSSHEEPGWEMGESALVDAGSKRVVSLEVPVLRRGVTRWSRCHRRPEKECRGQLH